MASVSSSSHATLTSLPVNDKRNVDPATEEPARQAPTGGPGSLLNRQPGANRMQHNLNRRFSTSSLSSSSASSVGEPENPVHRWRQDVSRSLEDTDDSLTSIRSSIDGANYTRLSSDAPRDELDKLQRQTKQLKTRLQNLNEDEMKTLQKDNELKEELLKLDEHNKKLDAYKQAMKEQQETFEAQSLLRSLEATLKIMSQAQQAALRLIS